MGNGIGLIIGLAFIIIGIIVAVLTVTGFIAQAIASQFLSAMQVYFIGAIISIICFVFGGLILLKS